MVRQNFHFLKNCKSANTISGYLNVLSGRARRSSLSRLRLGTLDLEIEKGRSRSIPRSERHCRICSLSEVENEEHFILFCPALSKCRDNFINRIASIKTNFASMSAENRVKFLFFNESLPHSLLELSSEMLVSLLETRRSLINLIENRQLPPR